MYDNYIKYEFIKHYQKERLSAARTEQILEQLFKENREPRLGIQDRFRVNIGNAFIAVGRWLNGQGEGATLRQLSLQPKAECVPCD